MFKKRIPRLKAIPPFTTLGFCVNYMAITGQIATDVRLPLGLVKSVYCCVLCHHSQKHCRTSQKITKLTSRKPTSMRTVVLWCLVPIFRSQSLYSLPPCENTSIFSVLDRIWFLKVYRNSCKEI